MTGSVAFSIDGLLPGIPIIADELTPQTQSQAQEVIVFFILGMGIGTFFFWSNLGLYWTTLSGHSQDIIILQWLQQRSYHAF